ncbi:MAG: YSC84-related protein [Burkholderiaceae bacterium]|jgi:lipid-binding SYLF domain-containing protein|nr:YSC84-related protein [Burkholderiaceae bacterium]
MQRDPTPFAERRRVLGLGLLLLASSGLGACTTTGPTGASTAVAKRTEIDAEVNTTLTKLYETAPGSRELVERASGVLVFPRVIRVAFGIGGAHGDGALLGKDGRTLGYYTVNAASIGLQAGAQSQAAVYLFMTPDALQRFRASNGWTAGVDATVAVAKVGANGRIDTASAQQPIIQFVMTNAGLAAGVALEGAKVTPMST